MNRVQAQFWQASLTASNLDIDRLSTGVAAGSDLRITSHFLSRLPGTPFWRLEPRDLPLQEVWLTSADGTKLHGWWIHDKKARLTFLAFHGNAGNMADRATIYEFLRTVPANVFALEYRGYGHSTGKPSESGLYADAEAAYQYLVNTQHLDPKTIVSYGQSLGTAVAAHLAARHEVGAVVLEAPFLSATSIATHVFRFLPGLQLLVYSQFDTQTQLKNINAPIFVVHCRRDPVLPFQVGARSLRGEQTAQSIFGDRRLLPRGGIGSCARQIPSSVAEFFKWTLRPNEVMTGSQTAYFSFTT